MRIACIGDIHGFWDAADTAYFNQSLYELLLFVGDLPRIADGRGVARELARLTKPAWLIPGNHDGCSLPQLLAEVKGWRLLRSLGAVGMSARMRALEQALGPVRVGGFNAVSLSEQVSLIIARPHAMGPDRFYFAGHMRRAWGLRDYRQSADKLKALVDNAAEKLIFLAHNGPAGLGDKPGDIWGCDFSPEFGDFGDPDLREAVDHARASGRSVLAVIAGHMHHRHKRGGGERRHSLREQGTLYLNAAAVPRIRQAGARRHHLALTLDEHGVSATEIWVSAEGRILDTQHAR